MQSACEYFYPEGNTSMFVPTLTAVSEGSEISLGSEQSAMNVLADYSESGEYESILDSSDLVPLGTSEITVSTSEGSANASTPLISAEFADDKFSSSKAVSAFRVTSSTKPFGLSRISDAVEESEFSLDSSSITVSANLSELDLLSEYGEYYTASKSVSESSVTSVVENESSVSEADYGMSVTVYCISGADFNFKTEVLTMIPEFTQIDASKSTEFVQQNYSLVGIHKLNESSEIHEFVAMVVIQVQLFFFDTKHFLSLL